MSIQNVKEAYTMSEWTAREQYYIKECAAIVLPQDPDPKSIMRLTSQIDDVLAESLMDQAYIKRRYLDYKTKMGLAEKEYFVTLKQQYSNPTGSAAPMKLTENEVKGLVVKYLRSHPIYGMKHDIYTLVQSVEYRLTFIESVVKILTEKKAALISDNAMLKIESSISGNTP